MSLNQELNKLTEQINIISSNKAFINYESRMNRVGTQIERLKKELGSKKSIYSEYASNHRKKIRELRETF